MTAQCGIVSDICPHGPAQFSDVYCGLFQMALPLTLFSHVYIYNKLCPPQNVEAVITFPFLSFLIFIQYLYFPIDQMARVNKIFKVLFRNEDLLTGYFIYKVWEYIE